MPTEIESSVRTLRFVVVDDNPDAAEGLCVVVRLWGHECWYALSGATGFELVVEHRPDVILSDLAMPELDGMELAKMIRRQTVVQQPLLIAVTGHGDESHRRGAFAAGFDYFLIKPVDPLELQAIVDQHFAADE